MEFCEQCESENYCSLCGDDLYLSLNNDKCLSDCTGESGEQLIK